MFGVHKRWSNRSKKPLNFRGSTPENGKETRWQHDALHFTPLHFLDFWRHSNQSALDTYYEVSMIILYYIILYYVILYYIILYYILYIRVCVYLHLDPWWCIGSHAETCWNSGIWEVLWGVLQSLLHLHLWPSTPATQRETRWVSWAMPRVDRLVDTLVGSFSDWSSPTPVASRLFHSWLFQPLVDGWNQLLDSGQAISPWVH